MAERTDWRKAVRDIAWRIAPKENQPDYPARDLVALRRLKPEMPDGKAFWELAYDHAPEAYENDKAATALAAIVQCFAIAHPFHRPRGGERPRFGEGLAIAGVHEARLLRLAHAGRAELPAELRRIARLLASKGDDGRADWSQVFDLLYWDDAEKTRRAIAKDYYQQQFKSEKEQAA